MTGYEVKIINASKELTGKEKVRIKDFTNATQLDDIIQGKDHFTLNYEFYVDMEVHNEHSKMDKDYFKRVIVDKEGNTYVTGSKSFCNAMDGVIEEMGEEEFSLDCYKSDSKNYTGKQFLSCTVI